MDEWIWCWQCKRVSRCSEWQQARPRQSVAYMKAGDKDCPYAGCDGLLLNSGKPYSQMRAMVPEWPETPERDMVYHSLRFTSVSYR